MRGGNSGEFLLSRDHAGEGAIKSRIGPVYPEGPGASPRGRGRDGRAPRTGGKAAQPPLVAREIVHQKVGRSENTFPPA